MRDGVVRKALCARLVPRPGKEAEVASFVRGLVALVAGEPDTTAWFGSRLSRSVFAIFGVFQDDAGRQAHLTSGGSRARPLAAVHMLARPPHIQMADVLAVKLCEELVTRGVVVALAARRGMEADVENALRAALPLAGEEAGTVAWFAVRFGPSTFATMGYFPDDEARTAHLNGRVMKALLVSGSDLLVGTPAIARLHVLAAKLDEGY